MADENQDKTALPLIRTLRSDAERYAASKKTSLITATALEMKKRASVKIYSPEHRHLKGAVITFIILVAALAGTGIYYWQFYGVPKTEERPDPVLISLITAEKKKFVKLGAEDKDKLLSASEEFLFTPLADGAFRIAAFTKQSEDGKEELIGPADFFRIVELKPPSRLFLNTEVYNLGSVVIDKTPLPFLILKIRSYNEAFAGMLEWEKNMPEEFRFLFKKEPALGPEEILFKDSVIKNQDVRILEDEGQIIFVYSFFNKNLLIITDSVKALEEIIFRLSILPQG